MRWISVKISIPPKRQFLIVYDSIRKMIGYQTPGQFINEDIILWSLEESDIKEPENHVTHWTHLSSAFIKHSPVHDAILSEAQKEILLPKE